MKKMLLTKTVHFGFVTDTSPAGAVIEIADDNSKFTFRGKDYAEMRDLSIVQNMKLLVPYTDELFAKVKGTVVVQEKKRDMDAEKNSIRKPSQMKVIRSDDEMLDRTIEIPKAVLKPERVKPAGMPVVRETQTDTIRGVKVIRQVEQIENGQELEIENRFDGKTAGTAVQRAPKRGRPPKRILVTADTPPPVSTVPTAAEVDLSPEVNP